MAGEAPLTLVHGRPVVTLDGGVRAIVDTGATAVLMTQSLADSIDLQVIETVEERGEVFTVLEPPALSVGGYELDVDGLPSYGFEDTRAIGLAALGVDLLLPGSLVARHAVELDVVGETSRWGAPGSLDRFGVRVGARVDDGVRVVVDCEVFGGAVSLLLDTGVSCCLAADAVVQAWRAAMDDLPTSAACVGPGNMAGLAVEARTPMVRVPVLEWGREFTVPGVAFVWRADADVAPYDGSLGGNVLRSFRLGLDLSRGDVYVEQRAPAAPGGGGDADQVGVTLVLDDEGDWVIGSTVTGLSPAVQVGDALVAIDGAPVGGVPLGDVLGALSGVPGETTHHLVLRRDDSGLVEADAPVLRVL